MTEEEFKKFLEKIDWWRLFEDPEEIGLVANLPWLNLILNIIIIVLLLWKR